MVVIKLVAILAAIIAYFGLLGFGPWYRQLPVQLAALAAVVVWDALRRSWRETLGLLKGTLPFIASLLFFGVIFQLARLQGRTDWLHDTLIKCVIFPSSLVFLRAILSYITYLDILALPLSMDRRFDLITVKAAFQKGGQALGRFTWYLEGYPYLAAEPGWRGALRHQAAKYASLILSLYLFLYEETEHAYLLLQNRYRHLQEGSQ